MVIWIPALFNLPNELGPRHLNTGQRILEFQIAPSVVFGSHFHAPSSHGMLLTTDFVGSVVPGERARFLACTDQNLVIKYKASAPEVEANYFAAELLMPEKLFIPRIKNSRPSFELIQSSAQEFGTSLTATAIRCAEVTDDYWAIVVSERGVVRWWRGSENFEECFWIEAGMPVSSNSVAGSVFQGETPPTSPTEVDAEEWAECKPGHDHEIHIEEVLQLEAYGQILSLLYLP